MPALQSFDTVVKRQTNGERLLNMLLKREEVRAEILDQAKDVATDEHRILGMNLPLWAGVVVVIAIIIVVLFILSTLGCFVKERRNSKKTGDAIPWKHIIMFAIQISTGAIIPLGIFKLIRKLLSGDGDGNSPSSFPPSGGAGGSSEGSFPEKGRYTHIQDDSYHSQPQFDHRPYRSSVGGGPAGSSSHVDARYEPMTYKSHVYSNSNPHAAYAAPQQGYGHHARGQSASKPGKNGAVNVHVSVASPPPQKNQQRGYNGYHQPPPRR